jgi:hypothetical protein
MPYGPGTYGSKVGRPKKKSMLSDDRETYGAGAIVRKGIKAVKRSSEMKGLKKDIAKGLELDNTYNTKLKDLKSKNASDAQIKKVREDMISNIEDVSIMQDMLKQLDEGVSSRGTSGKSKFGLDEDRSEFAIGGIITKLFKLAKKEQPKKVKEQDIDRILDNLSDEQMSKLSPIEIEQLLDMDLAKSGVDNIPTKSTRKDIDEVLGGLTDKEMENLSDIEIEQLLDMDLEKYGRKGKVTGGLLDDDRQTYGMGSLVTKLIKQGSKVDSVKVIKGLETKADNLYKVRESIQKNKKEYDAENYNDALASIDDSINSINDELRELGIKPSKKNYEAKTRANKADGGMLPDNDMEENYTRFIMDEALSEEEEDMLVTKLEQDKELQMLFDKVIDVAQEFAGNGPVEGPGTGVSDDIPARLSDGEFVFTAKAVEEIGEDTLMSMMKEAEAAADGRQKAMNGGLMSQQKAMNENKNVMYGQEQTPDINEEIQKQMLGYPVIR